METHLKNLKSEVSILIEGEKRRITHIKLGGKSIKHEKVLKSLEVLKTSTQALENFHTQKLINNFKTTLFLFRI